MTHADLSPVRQTSVTMRTTTRASLIAAVALLGTRGHAFSEQRLMRECLRYALKFWRGRGSIAVRNKKYNKRTGPYEIVPLYTTEALRRVAWARCHHSGVSLSRLMDFAVSSYMPRVVEAWLSGRYHWRDPEDVETWRRKYALRRDPSRFVISYTSITANNNAFLLEFTEKSEIQPWPPPLRAVA